VCDAAMIECVGLRAIYQAGNMMDAYEDFAAPGGIKTINRSISPRSTASSREISNW
jgi:hypothetical protein